MTVDGVTAVLRTGVTTRSGKQRCGACCTSALLRVQGIGSCTSALLRISITQRRRSRGKHDRETPRATAGTHAHAGLQ